MFSSSSPSPSLEQTRSQAAGGDTDAQFGLGLKYGCGEGVALDFAEAAVWYRRAADQNHALAQFNLAMMYAEGQGVPQSDADAALWIRRAANRGDAGAQFQLGARCQRASFDGLPRDAVESKIEAYKWFRLAAAQGYRNSDMASENLNLRMTQEEVTEGDRRTARFVAAPLVGAD